MATGYYTFALNSFVIHNKRSGHYMTDTDYASLTLSVAHGNPQTIIQAMGDLDDGTYQTDLSFMNVPVEDNQAVVLSYLIVNNGHSDPAKIEEALQAAASDLGQTAVQEAATELAGAALGDTITIVLGDAGDVVCPIVGGILGAVAGWVIGKIGSILFADCDGVVAAGVHAFSGAKLRAGTSNEGIIHGSDNNPGYNSPAGCGCNSDYVVNWSIGGPVVVRPPIIRPRPITPPTPPGRLTP